MNIMVRNENVLILPYSEALCTPRLLPIWAKGSSDDIDRGGKESGGYRFIR